MRGTRAAHVQRWYDEGYYSGRTMRDRMDDAAERFADKEIVVWSPTRPTRATVGEARGRAKRLAGALADRGLRPGDVVALQMPNWLEAVVLYHACLELGLVVLPIIHIYGVTEVDHILRSAGARAILTPTEWNGLPFADRAYTERHEDLLWILTDEAPDGATSLAALEDAGHTGYARATLDPDDVHIVNYTSGTTADPKGVLHTHNSLAHENVALAACTHDEPGREVMVSPNPVGHIAGLLANVLFPVLRGQKIVMMDGWDPGACLELYEEHGATRSGGAPFFLTTLLDHPDLGSRDFSKMRVFGCGGAGVPPELIERAEQAGLVSFRAYGSTEHPSITSGTIEDGVDVRAHTDGRPMLGIQVRIVDEEGKDLPPGREGEIWSMGPDMCVGYRDERHNEAFTDDGWYRSGDLGVMDARGCVRITGRIKDIIVRGGENISASEVEAVLAQHPKVMEAAAFAIPDERYGERVCACVVLRRDDDPLGFDEMSEHFRGAGIARQKTPERLEAVEALPRTLAGKVQKYKLRAQVLGEAEGSTQR